LEFEILEFIWDLVLEIWNFVKPHKPDYILIGATAAIVVFGLIMLWSASMVKSQEIGQPYYYLKHQALNLLLLGLPAAFLTSKINYKFWKKISFPLFIASIVMLILVFLPHLGFTAGGATRWLALGPLSIQPSEVAKLGIVIYLASLFANRTAATTKRLDSHSKTDDKQAFITFIVSVGIIAGLVVLQPNISTTGIICLTAAIIYFVSGAPIWQMGTLILMGVSGLFAFMSIFSHASKRFQIFLHPEMDPKGIGYQINQALLAIGSGGFFGRGLGQSLQKFNFLPEAMGDSIFAITAEELGFVGATILIAVFLLFAIRGFKIAKDAPDSLSKLLATGITSWIILQAFINIAAISGLMPLTGVPLPFISYGSSNLIISLAAVGILVNISKYSVK
jgi:cell division protein FtsW